MFNLTVIQDEPRILDLELARALEFERPLDIRKLIKRNIKKLKQINVLATVAQTTGEEGGRPTEVYYLDQKQAIFICMKSETARAFDIQIEIIKVYYDFINGTYRPKDEIELMLQSMKNMKQQMLGFQQMSLESRKTMRQTHWNLQQSLGLTSKRAMNKRIKMRAPLNLLINGISSRQLRLVIGLTQYHRDSSNRPMKTVDFLPLANQEALFRADVQLLRHLEECKYDVSYKDACTMYLLYGNLAKIEIERLYNVDLHDSINEALQDLIAHVDSQIEANVSPYGICENKLTELEDQLKANLKDLEIRRKCLTIKRRPLSQAA